MSGSSSAVLSGLSTPIALSGWDHTYVASDCGWVWRCWGAHTGGRVLVQAVGNSLVADCLSHPLGTAHIRYGIDGVCHQTANRILIPAQRRVSSARGYNISFSTFGHYGRKWHPTWNAWLQRLAACMGTQSSTGAVDHVYVHRQQVVRKGSTMTDDKLAPGGQEGNGPSFDALIRYMGGEGGAVEQVREMCNANLERPLAPEEESRLVGIQEWFEQTQKTLVMSLQSGRVGRTAYLDAMNALLADSMASYAEVLGEKRFLQIFGEAGYETDMLIDKATFLGAP